MCYRQILVVQKFLQDVSDYAMHHQNWQQYIIKCQNKSEKLPKLLTIT